MFYFLHWLYAYGEAIERSLIHVKVHEDRLACAQASRAIIVHFNSLYLHEVVSSRRSSTPTRVTITGDNKGCQHVFY